MTKNPGVKSNLKAEFSVGTQDFRKLARSASFSVTIECDNAAFDDGNREAETARILRDVARWVEDGLKSGLLFDVNGNRVGEFKATGQGAR